MHGIIYKKIQLISKAAFIICIASFSIMLFGAQDSSEKILHDMLKADHVSQRDIDALANLLYERNQNPCQCIVSLMEKKISLHTKEPVKPVDALKKTSIICDNSIDRNECNALRQSWEILQNNIAYSLRRQPVFPLYNLKNDAFRVMLFRNAPGSYTDWLGNKTFRININSNAELLHEMTHVIFGDAVLKKMYQHNMQVQKLLEMRADLVPVACGSLQQAQQYKNKIETEEKKSIERGGSHYSFKQTAAWLNTVYKLRVAFDRQKNRSKTSDDIKK